MNNQFKTVLAPFPLTLLSVFGFYLYRRIGQIVPDTVTRFNYYSKGKGASREFMGNGFVLNLAYNELYNSLEVLIRTLPQTDQGLLRRYLTFAQSAPKQKVEPLLRFITLSVLENINDLKSVMDKLSEMINSWIAEQLDPWNPSGLPVPELEICQAPESHPKDQRFLSLPIFNSGKIHKTDDDITGIREVKLLEGFITKLVNHNIGIVIGGPSGSGKSTLAVSLVHEIRNIIRGLQTRIGWQDFELGVQFANLDLATPTVDAINTGSGQNREVLNQIKRRWTTELALEAHTVLKEALNKSNLVFGDLPGGAPDEITEIIASGAHASILISSDWEVSIPLWQDFSKMMGLPVLSRIRSRRSIDEGFASVVTLYEPQKRVTGRVVGLNRTNRPYDPFISWLAELLVFDLLPALVS